MRETGGSRREYRKPEKLSRLRITLSRVLCSVILVPETTMKVSNRKLKNLLERVNQISRITVIPEILRHTYGILWEKFFAEIFPNFKIFLRKRCKMKLE